MNVSLRCGYSPGPSNSEDMTCSCGATSGLRTAGGLDTKGVDIALYTSIDPAARQKFQKNEQNGGVRPIHHGKPVLLRCLHRLTQGQSHAALLAAHRSRLVSYKRTRRPRRPLSPAPSRGAHARPENTLPLSCRCARRDRPPETSAAASAYSA